MAAAFPHFWVNEVGLNMTLIGPSTWGLADDPIGQSIDIRGQSPELIDGR
jgi:hypothetical protein